MSNAFKKSLGRLANAVHKQQCVRTVAKTPERFLSGDAIKVLEAMPDGASLHYASGEALWISAKTAALLNGSADDLTGQLVFDGVNPQDRPRVFQAFSNCCADGMNETIDFRLQISKAGNAPEKTHFELQLSPFKYGDQTLALATLKKKRASADQTTQPHSSTRLARISHELRTPLNAINGFSQMLMGEGDFAPDREKRAEYAKLINQSSLHLLDLVNDILDTSKTGLEQTALNKVLFDLTSGIEDILNQMAPIAAKAGVTLCHDIDESLPKIFADERTVRQVLINLIANAIKFSGKGKTVTVKASRSLKKVSLEVSDNGIGMSKDSLSRLGNEYFQADACHANSNEGTGLGLSIVKDLVQMHEGILTFDSVQGRGTTVSVELPISSGASTPIPSNPEHEIVYLSKSREPNLLRRLDEGQTIRKTG